VLFYTGSFHKKRVQQNSVIIYSAGGWDKEESSENLINDIYGSRILVDREVEL